MTEEQKAGAAREAAMGQSGAAPKQPLGNETPGERSADFAATSTGCCEGAGRSAASSSAWRSVHSEGAAHAASGQHAKDVMAAARENLRQIAPKQLVLISSIAVYADSRGKDEQSPMTPDGLPAYGRNRLQLERWVREDYPNALIVRLPALYGIGLKKNFLFDLHTITPAMLKPEKYTELAQKSPLVRDGYTLADNGFYKLNGAVDAAALREFFAGNDFNALAFTDSRSRYQFYHLARLWQDVQTALQNGLTTLNLTTPPVTAAEVYTTVTGKADWQNELPKPPFDYDLRSRHAALLGGADGYLCTKQQELDEICAFMRAWRN